MTIREILQDKATCSSGEEAPTYTVRRKLRNLNLNQETVINQLKEITGVQDPAALRHAYEASDGDISQAIAFLTEGHENPQGIPRPTSLPGKARPLPIAATPANPPANAPANAYGPRNRPQGEARSSDVIDLTQDRDEKEDLQRAIALSLQETSQASIGVSAEEQDISRVLEQSIRDAGQSRSNGWFVDPLNPHDRQRESGWPVGLKNVGNTCWFSAVIQSLFHLPAFRQLVLTFDVLPRPDSGSGGDVNSLEQRNLLFMSELRSLFALMLGTRRKYVDPSKSVHILKAAFSSGSSDNQQDVSEFTHKLLEWLEDAFKLGTSAQPSQDGGAEGEATPSKNPMLELFYGQFKVEGINEGKVFSNQETFGQCPLQINGYSDLHQSLEASMSKGEIETINGDPTYRSAQEHWFTRLPKVLIFELSRFQFNQRLGRPEKIHNEFKFPSILYMDRYMECNREVVRKKREEVAVLRQKYAELQTRLNRFLCYGSGPKRMPLSDVLQYTLEYANSGSPDLPHLRGEVGGSSPQRVCPDPSASEDVEMTSPCGSARNSPRPGLSPGIHAMQQGFSPPSPTRLASISSLTPPSSSTPAAPSPSASSSAALSSKPRYTKPPPLSIPDKPPLSSSSANVGGIPTPTGGAGGLKGECPSPKPGHITDTELDILQGCLRRWRTEVMREVKDLHDEIARINDQIHTAYEESQLKYHKYRLHAVLVHQGQALAGHYWSYILNHKRNVWIKFNDIAVTEVTREELERVSVGGDGNASAYCVMYVESGNRALFEETHADTGLINLDDLANDLRQLIVDDNQKFEDELRQWDEQVQQHRQQQLQQQLQQGERGQADGGTRERERVVSRGASTTHQQVEGGIAAPPEDVPMRDESMSPRRVPPLHNLDSMETGHPETTRPSTPKSPKTPKTPVSHAPFFGEGGPESALQQMYSETLKKSQELANSPDPQYSDIRLEGLPVYLLRNNAPNNVVQLSVLLHLKELGLASSDLRNQAIGKISQRKLEGDPAFTSLKPELSRWENDYNSFLRVVGFFNQGISLGLKQGLSQEALPYFVHACQLNDTFEESERDKRLDGELLAFYRRDCLLQLSEHCANVFDGGEEGDASQSLGVMSEQVVPCIGLLAAGNGNDARVVEEIRERWCTYLGQEISGKLQDKLQDLLSKLLDSTTEATSIRKPPLVCSERNANQMQQFMETMRIIESTEQARQTSSAS